MAKRSKSKNQSSAGTASGDIPATNRNRILHVLWIVGAAIWIYAPALHGDWLWDDNLYITDNHTLHESGGLWKAWFVPGSFVDYYPIEQTVLWIQWHLWHADTLGYHVTTLLLHIVSALLVWRLLGKLGLHLAWLGGLIFAIHPVQVESVAWISELKNTLSLPPFLLAMGCWIDYEDRRQPRDYWLALGFFLVAMLCKITMALFPVLILLYAWWKRGRIGWSDLKAGAPFFVLFLVLGMATIMSGIWYRQHRYLPDDVVAIGGVFPRLALVGLSISFYFSKFLLPLGLVPVYPRWIIDPPSLLQFLPWPILFGVIYVLWTKRKSWGRHALLGLGFFLIFLAPFLGFNQVSYMKFTWVMDHFLYIPIIGLIALVVAGLERAEPMLSGNARSCAVGFLVVILGLWAWESHGYAAHYRDAEALWNYTLTRNPEAWLARNNLGNAFLSEGRLAEAMEQYQLAFQLKPDFAEAHYNLGNILEKTGRMPEAMDEYREALRLKPDYADAHYNLANGLQQAGHYAEAVDHYQQAWKFDPDYASAHNNMGLCLQLTGHFPEAIEQYEQAVQIKPDYAEAHNNLGNALQQTGRLPEAMEHYEEAVRLKPDYVGARNNMGLCLQQEGRMVEAAEQFETALQADPGDALTHYNLANILQQTGHSAEAMDHYKEALRLKPDYAAAENNMGVALAEMGKIAEATEHIKTAVKLDPNYAEARNNLTRLQSLQKSPPARN